jgi:hypothetical protein
MISTVQYRSDGPDAKPRENCGKKYSRESVLRHLKASFAFFNFIITLVLSVTFLSVTPYLNLEQINSKVIVICTFYASSYQNLLEQLNFSIAKSNKISSAEKAPLPRPCNH